MSFRRKIVAGNWKMNNSLAEALTLVDGVIAHLDPNTITEVIICPSYAVLAPIHAHLQGMPKIRLGAQNCSEFNSGAYTGEVSAQMITSVGCQYVIVGHSERRTYCNESSEQLTQKMKRALENKLHPIFCIGENLEERNGAKHFDIVKGQLKNVLSTFSLHDLKELLIAYEPVWAIGTGVTATSAQAQEMHAFIRKTISELFSVDFANTLPILYGGSCNALNAKELFACKDVDGGLIGGASLKAEDFCKIISSF
ncbi:MAG: triose-phosphate isomerase [Sphingobacteriaceae bacterium]|nr:triose-phosphate isomerase [Sphingobacteriaceae bacterium]MBK7817079.1 triose-phosphate isomerase [Sphingobacteriaceae bacterium]